MKLWHDDIRRPPDDSWYWVRTNMMARLMLFVNCGEGLEDPITECSLDHDLGLDGLDPAELESPDVLRGTSEETGLDLVKWMVREGFVPPKVTVHSWNRYEAERMAEELRDWSERTGRLVEVVVEPFDPEVRRA